MTTRPGKSFQDADVVDLYLHRPPYPTKLYDLIAAHAPRQGRLLDIGCGHGKVCRPLAPTFAQITAVDPSARMLELARTLPLGNAENITWIHGYAENVPLHGQYDVVVAALSIHWMEHAHLFPKLAAHIPGDHLFAVIEGDGPHDAPWEDDWQAFLSKWIPKMTGQAFPQPGRKSIWDQHLPYIASSEVHELVSDPVRQSIDDFILCQHSRDTFTPSKMGGHRSAFDTELAAMLRPHADGAGHLTYQVSTKLTLAQIVT